MQKTLLAVGLVAGIGLVGGVGAQAAPMSAAGVQAAVTAASPLQQARLYSERRTKHGVVKCYHDFVIGAYHCHFFPNPI